ncbi:MAG: hypothetical protein K6E35_07775 [Bacteroidales bacterium]|nr:hypothetical protein [Bacteroidales bacterium]
MLFNKDNHGSAELQQLTGYFPASNDYSVIASEIDYAMRTVRGLIGDTVMSAAESAYDSGTNLAFVRAVQLPVATLAVAYYTRNNLVTHDDSGSKVRVDDHEKMPWEWMIDRDERAQQERWYRALDALYEYLDKNSVSGWMASAVYARIKRSIVKTMDDMDAVYPLDGSYYVYYLLQGLVVECQGRLRKMVGEAKWAVISGTSVPEADMDLLRACQRWAILSALVTAVRRWSLEVFPLSIARRFCPSYQGGRSKTAATLEEMNAYVDALSDQIGAAHEEIAEQLTGGNPWEDFDPQPRNSPDNKFFTAQ